MFKRIALTILGLLIMFFGVWGIILWWWPFLKTFLLGIVGLAIFLVGLIAFIAGVTMAEEGKEKK